MYKSRMSMSKAGVSAVGSTEFNSSFHSHARLEACVHCLTMTLTHLLVNQIKVQDGPKPRHFPFVCGLGYLFQPHYCDILCIIIICLTLSIIPSDVQPIVCIIPPNPSRKHLQTLTKLKGSSPCPQVASLKDGVQAHNPVVQIFCKFILSKLRLSCKQRSLETTDDSNSVSVRWPASY